MPFVLCLTEASREVQGSGDVVLLSKERGERERNAGRGRRFTAERRMGWATSWLALLYSIVTAGAMRLSVLRGG